MRTALAESKGVQFRYEGTVVAGTPVLNLGEFTLAGNEITEIRGILNGTTNYILTKMEEGQAYEAVLKCSHLFNVLDARGALSVTERATSIQRIRRLACRCADAHFAQREAKGFPLTTQQSGRQARTG